MLCFSLSIYSYGSSTQQSQVLNPTKNLFMHCFQIFVVFVLDYWIMQKYIKSFLWDGFSAFFDVYVLNVILWGDISI